MTLERRLKEKREEILRLCAKHGARNVRVFGSVARGEADEESDIDFIVELEPGRSLLDHAALWLELQELLGGKLDVVSEHGIKPRIRERVLKEAVPLWETPKRACAILWRSSRLFSGIRTATVLRWSETNFCRTDLCGTIWTEKRTPGRRKRPEPPRV